MIFGILFGIWLVVAVVIFAMQFDPDEWLGGAILAVIWPLAFLFVLAVAISGATTEAYARLRNSMRSRHE